MAIKRVNLAPLQQSMPIVDAQGRPTTVFLNFINGTIQSLKNSVNDLIDIENAVEAANAAATAANDAAAAAQSAANDANDAATGAQATADATSSEQSLINSGLINYTPPAIEASITGAVTIANHDRVYGNPTLDPTVSVTGDTVMSGFIGDDLVYIFYDDPSRAGGAVAYQMSLDSSDAVQGGARHSVGSVVIPTIGTSEGIPVLPRGVT